MNDSGKKGTCKCPSKSNTHLAIASIPIQPMGELYDLKTALKNGTLFQNLDMPFFMGVDEVIISKNTKEVKGERQNAMDKIHEVSFALSELILYLDTHPTDEEALNLYREYRDERKGLLSDFAQNFEPLNCDCVDISISDSEETKKDTTYIDQKHFTWVDGPLPWEGGLA